MKTVIDFIREGLIANGYAGLCNAIRECGCPVDDLAPNDRDCCDIQECVPVRMTLIIVPSMYRECKNCKRRDAINDSKNYVGGDCFYVPEDSE